VALAALLLLTANGVVAQQNRIAEGRVTRAAQKGPPQPVARQWVVMHRVGSDRGAPVDSAQTDRRGRYRIRYTTSGDADALYFVSARYDGIAYFSPPIRVARVTGGDADILVYPTTQDTSTLRVQGRHLVVSSPRGRNREIAEIFEIENTGWQTVVARDSATPVWSVILPPQAESASVAPGDLSIASVQFRNGRAEVFSPMSPGVRQLVLTYSLPPGAFPLTIPLTRPVSVLEVLLEEPRAVVQGGPLAEVAPAPIEGRMFRRFLAQDVPPMAVMRISAPPPVEQNRSAIVIVGVASAGVMLLSLALWARRRRALPMSDVRYPMAAVEPLFAQLATLDAHFERDSVTDQSSREAYARERAALKERIARALAAGNKSA
jgi:hypothetical protein